MENTKEIWVIIFLVMCQWTMSIIILIWARKFGPYKIIILFLLLFCFAYYFIILFRAQQVKGEKWAFT